MKKQSNDQKGVNSFPHQNKVVNILNVSFPTPQKQKILETPDFSPIIKLENTFILKTSSYKKRAIIEPESPVKTPNTDYLTPLKIEGKDLFGTKQNNKCFRKLIFEDVDNKAYLLNNKENDHEMNNFLKKFNMNDCDNNNNNINPTTYKNNNSINKIKQCDKRMENEYDIIKTINEKKFDAVYIVKEKCSGKLFFIKKISKKSKKNNFNTIETLFNDMNKNINNNELGSQFCMKYIDYWIENENYELIKEDINYMNKNLYILLEYFPFGDILDYLQRLKDNKYKFTSNFYWDIFFEMIIGLLYFHNQGYIHFDIKPTNFIVDNNGYIRLNDFGLSHKKDELSKIDDIIEGDSIYISKEVFDNIDNISNSNIDNRCDVFSLGLSFLEIFANIFLPPNGKLWKDLRSDDFVFPEEEFLKNCNIKDNEEFIKLIRQMISPINNRPYLIQLIETYPELNKRYQMLLKNQYEKSCEILQIKKIKTK